MRLGWLQFWPGVLFFLEKFGFFFLRMEAAHACTCRPLTSMQGQWLAAGGFLRSIDTIDRTAAYPVHAQFWMAWSFDGFGMVLRFLFVRRDLDRDLEASG